MSDESLITDEEQEAHEQVIPGVTAGAVIDAMDNPEMFEQMARADLYVQMAHMRRQSKHPDFSTNARLEYMKYLGRMGKVSDPPKDATSLDHIPQISIVLPNSGGQINIGASPVQQEKIIDQQVEDSEPPKPSKAIIPS